jgi:hypothetical protein
VVHEAPGGRCNAKEAVRSRALLLQIKWSVLSIYDAFGSVTPLSNELVEGVSIDDVPAVRIRLTFRSHRPGLIYIIINTGLCR